MKAGIFDGPQFCKLIQDQAVTSHMTAVKSAAWCSHVSVVREFLGNTKGKQLPVSCGCDAQKLSSSLFKDEHQTSLSI